MDTRSRQMKELAVLLSRGFSDVRTLKDRETALEQLRWLLRDSAFEKPLRKLRKSAGLTQMQVATKSGMPQGLYSQYETNARALSPAHAERLAEALGASPEDLEVAQVIGELRSQAMKGQMHPEDYLREMLFLNDTLPDGPEWNVLRQAMFDWFQEELLARKERRPTALKSGEGTRDGLGRRKDKRFKRRW